MYDVYKIREDFPILKEKMHGKPLVYLDNAATTQKPIQVINTIVDFYEHYNANIHRGIYEIAEKATEAYTTSKEKVAKFINADSFREIIYVRNATEAINLVARTYGEDNIKENDYILTTGMEHHSNIVPWQLLSIRKKAKLAFVNLNGPFLDIEDYKEKVEKLRPKIVTITHVSNVLGTINDVKTLVAIAHKYGATTIVDGAQSVPHMKIDVKDIDCDFLAFSGHKMLAPTGIGVLYGKEELLENMSPFLGGGDMIRSVDYDESTWNDLPWKFEAGTSNIEGGIALGSAIDYIEKIGIENINKHEKDLVEYALNKFNEYKEVIVYGPEIKDIEKKAGVISFNIPNLHAHDVASIFDNEGVAIRAGHHCAMPLLRRIIGISATARMSFYLYNTKEDIDIAFNALEKALKIAKEL